jgi:hypothetical protein
MFLFSRRGRVAGGQAQAARTWALDVTEAANALSENPVTLWIGVLGPEVGTVVWSSFAPDLMSIEQSMDRMQADEGFAALVDRGATVMPGGVDDRLAQIVHGEPDPGRDASYVTVVEAVCASRALARGMAVGVEVAQMAEKITGNPTLFANAVTGPYGSVAWITAHASIGDIEEQQRALAADAGWLDYLDREAGTAFQENAAMTTSRIYRRLA